MITKIRFQIICCTLMTLMSSGLFAKNYLTMMYDAKAGQTLKDISLSFLKDGNEPSRLNNSLLHTMNKNLNVVNKGEWNPFLKDVTIKLYLEVSVVDLAKYKDYFLKNNRNEMVVVNENDSPVKKDEFIEVEILKKSEKTQKEEPEKVVVSNRIVEVEKEKVQIKENRKPEMSGNSSKHLFTFSYLPSIGFLTQTDVTGLSVKNTQTSLISISGMYSYSQESNPLQFSASLNYSAISSKSNIENTSSENTISIPSEIAASVYGIYNLAASQFSYFGGIDFDKISSFNLNSLTNSSKIVIDSHGLYYLTAGMNYQPIFHQQSFFQLAISRSIYSTYSSEDSLSTKVSLNGMKFLFLYTLKISPNWSVNAMLKTQNLTGDNDLSIKRYGLGVSYTY